MHNVTRNPDDLRCSALNSETNTPVKCSKWIYDRSVLQSTVITEYDLVCDRDYHFETAFSLEQSGYILGTLVFGYMADIIGRKPVLISSMCGMVTLGIAQYFIIDFSSYFVVGFFINAFSCVSI